MNFTKPAISHIDQLKKLKDRGLIVNDEDFALHQLQHISYYRLAGYWWPFQSDKVNHIFKPNSKFETVISVYRFDSELRSLLFDVIEQIEISFRSKLAYQLSHEFGAWWFEDATIFDNTVEHSKALNLIDRELHNNKKEVFLKEHYKKYDTDTRRPPAWKTFEILSLGMLSKIYGNLKNTCTSKDAIAREFGTFNHTFLQPWLLSITQIRNICAHHGRVWNKNLPGRPKLMPKPLHPWVSKVPPVAEHHMLYVHLCCMKYLINVIHPGNNFTFRLFVLLKKYPNIDLNALGMHNGWQKEPLWNNRLHFGRVVRPMIYKVAFVFSSLRKQLRKK